MKKKSILLTCIVAIMALAMFVGCDNAPTLPSFVVSGSIDQTGDFLTGQNFDPKKFSVTVTYDNGKIVPADATVSVYLEDGGQKVYGGEVVMADLGKNYESQPVTAKGTVSVYNINRIEVAGGPESYVSIGGAKPVVGNASDYTVTAYYYDSDNVEKSMILGSTEYSVYWDGYVGNNKPSASNPSATGKFGIDVKVGGNVNGTTVDPVTFIEEVPVTFQAADVDFEFTELESIEVKGNITILGFADVVPEFDDYTIMVSDGTNSIPLESDPGIELSFLTNEYKPITDISKQTTVIVKAEYEGLEPVYCSANITPVTLDVNYNSGEVKFYKGQALPELKNSDLTVTYSYNGQTRYLDPADAEFVFATLAGEVYTPIADGKIPATATEIYVVGTYRGISDSYGPINVTDYQAPDVTAIKDVTLATGFALVKQIYEELPEASSAISSVTVVLDDETEEVIPAAELGDDSVVFTSDEAGNTPLTKDLTSATAAYVKVLIGSSAKVVPVTLSDAVVDELTVTLAYSDENANHSRLSFVDDTRHRSAHLFLQTFCHRTVFLTQFLAQKLFERFAEHVGIPSFFRFSQHIFRQRFDKLLALLLIPDRRAHFSAQIDANNMITRCICMQIDADASALSDQFRLGKAHFAIIGRHNAIAAILRVTEGFPQPFVNFFRIRQGGDIAHQSKIVFNRFSALFSEDFIKSSFSSLDTDVRMPLRRIKLYRNRRTQKFTFPEQGIQQSAIAHF